ncbi:MAG TPA: DUF4287 domain-containing protein [Patescibacteria group bacterium]|jgi:uncharacterized protein YndB with AHSA1/START domain
MTRISDEAVEKATGKRPKQWFALIDKAGGAELAHKEIARYLYDEQGVAGWWAQMITVEYERSRGKREVGETADVGFEVGVHKTVEISKAAAWKAVTSTNWMSRWLYATPRLVEGRPFNNEKVAGEVRVVQPGEKIRLAWKPTGWERSSTVQILVQTAPSGKTRLAFHHEKLADAKMRERMRAHWKAAATEVPGG